MRHRAHLVLPALAFAVAAAGLASCGGDGNDRSASTSRVSSTTTAAEGTGTSAPSTTDESGSDSLAGAAIDLTEIAHLDEPIALATRPGDDALYVAEKRGSVVKLTGGDPDTVLDISDDVVNSDEQGLLGMTFSPDGSKLYLHYSDRDSGGDTRVVELSFDGGAVDESSRRELLRLEQPQENHNGGGLLFGPDGLLYLGLGDGGGGGDEGDGHARGGNGQSLDTLLGKLLRIDPTPSGGREYTIPPDNPFAGGGGEPEIWAYGLRNPWRFSFDRQTSDLWIADVGQYEIEEIDFVPAGEGAGANFGWNVFEGSQQFRDGDAPNSLGPIHEYSHDDACSITGGYVYRGSAIPDLAGAYLYTDYCNGTIRALKRAPDGSVETRDDFGVSSESVTSFGEDANGELYVLSQDGGVYRIDPA